MKRLLHFMDWPLRAKMVALLVVASLLPLGIATFINIRETRARMLTNAAELLAARGDHLADQLDVFNLSYQRSVDRVAHLPRILDFYQARPADVKEITTIARQVLQIWPNSDPNIRGIALLDLTGKVKLATDDPLIGIDMSFHPHVREALRGGAVISDIYLAEKEVNNVPTIAYLAPVFLPDSKQLIGVVAFWVRAEALWNVMKASNELAGPGSYAVLFDRLGIRIGHTYSGDIVFHPGGAIDTATIDDLVAEQRFGEKTREILNDVRTFPEQFDRALADSPDQKIFRGFAPVNQTWNYGVGRRFKTVQWTIFYMVPERSLYASMTDMMRQNLVFAGLVALAALIAGAFLALVILRPVRSLSKATKMIEADDLSARVPRGYGDELGQLGSSFNSMAERIETQASKLEAANKELEAFSYSVSHDLRAPLRHINAYGHMLLEDYGEKLDDEAREYLEQIRASSHEMANLIDQVLELAKISRREIVPTAVDVTAMAEKAIRRLQKEAPERVVEVSIEPGMQANGDETLLKQVFENLIANAWKFTGKTENARITVGTESKDSSKVYLVRDNGAGFDMRYAANLFGAFQRLHAADEFEGTGIGLATVHRIITRHGGRIWAESEIKKGSTFYFELNNANSNANQASTRTVLKKRH